jgi:small subunit ribosomal protein S20
MANHTATKKSIRKAVRVTERNRARKSRVKTFLRVLEEALESTDQKVALEALKGFESEIMKAVAKGVFKKNTAARKVSRMSARVKQIGTKAAA